MDDGGNNQLQTTGPSATLSPQSHPLQSHSEDERAVAERLQLALDAGAILGTWVWDVPLDRVTADERFSRTFGLTPEQCQNGLPIDEVIPAIHAADRARVEAVIDEALSRGGRYRCEFRVRRDDGVYRWVEANGRVELGPDGRPRRFPGIILDIETRRAAEAERDRLIALLRTFALAVPGVVYAKDREGRMLVANQGTTELIGKPPEFYLGKTDMEFLDDKEQAAVIMETDRRIMQTGVSEQIEEEVRLPDGSEAIWLSTKTPLRDGSGGIIGLAGASIDVTARKRAEAALQELNRTLEQKIHKAIEERELAHEALRQSHKMEAVGQLTGGLAHDFNNLLTVISGSLENLQRRVAEGKVNEIERYIMAAQGAAMRAASLTHRLLAFSRRQTLDPKITDVRRLVGEMEDLIRRTAGPPIDIEVVGQAGLWLVRVDQNQLENALLNLCINARDAMPDGGRMTIEIANERFDDRAAAECDLPPGDYVALSVTDTGTGMSRDVMTRAFDPFYTTKPLGEGTGLGLSMIYGFVRQSGGQVQISSELGKGTRVCLYLPRDLGPQEAEAGAVAPLPSPKTVKGSGETILVVDDEPTVRMLVVEVLDEAGYAWIEAADGRTALSLLQSAPRVDLLITDVGLPGGMNGRQLADAARVLRPDLKVLFITGYAANAVVGNGCLEPGMQLLTKPFSMDALARRVRAILQT